MKNLAGVQRLLQIEIGRGNRNHSREDNDERRMSNDEARMTMVSYATANISSFDHSDLFRHSSFGFRHSVTPVFLALSIYYESGLMGFDWLTAASVAK